MADSLERIKEVLDAGMCGEDYVDEEYYIKECYIHDPIALDYQMLPVAVIKPSDERRVDVFVQEDEAVDQISIYLLPAPIARAKEYTVPSDATTAMADRASRLIREDPTFGARVINAQIIGSTFRQPGWTSGGDVHSVEIRVEVRQRALWRNV